MYTPSVSLFNTINKPVHFNNNNNKQLNYPQYNKTLTSDVVSFSGKYTPLANKMSDFLENDFSKKTPRFTRIATVYLDILESVASGLKDFGFSFDRAYCEKSPVKSPASYASKIVRSKNLKVPDMIRATLYCNTPYDLDSLNKLLLEMKKRGYVLDTTEVSINDLMKRGYRPTKKEMAEPDKIKKTIPDLDIRLEDVSEQVAKLPPELRYAISKPQKSGYEDIQMRFVREFDKKDPKKRPVSHELLIIFGPEYAKSKHDESKYVYNKIRKFEELNVDLSDKTTNPKSLKASRYIDLIRQMFRGKVSEKLFLNAKNKDLYGLNDEIPIYFTESDQKMFENYFSGLRDNVIDIYKTLRKNAGVSKTASKQTNQDLRNDKALLGELHDTLKDTIEHFNYQHDLKHNS